MTLLVPWLNLNSRWLTPGVLHGGHATAWSKQVSAVVRKSVSGGSGGLHASARYGRASTTSSCCPLFNSKLTSRGRQTVLGSVFYGPRRGRRDNCWPISRRKRIDDWHVCGDTEGDTNRRHPSFSRIIFGGIEVFKVIHDASSKRGSWLTFQVTMPFCQATLACCHLASGKRNLAVQNF